jgi:hypothetical protein
LLLKPRRYWELDDAGQPTQRIIERRRTAKFVTPIPKPKKHEEVRKKDSFSKKDRDFHGDREAGKRLDLSVFREVR